jgi:hypothetical protein
MNTRSVKLTSLAFASVAALASLSLLAACSSNSSGETTTSESVSEITVATSDTSSTNPTAPASSLDPASTTTQKTPTTEPPKTPAQTTTSAEGPAPEQVASSVASSLQATYGVAPFAAQYQTIWDQVRASGGTIQAVGSDASDPKNLLRPQSAAKYSLTVASSSFCITHTIDKASNTATFQTTIGKC